MPYFENSPLIAACVGKLVADGLITPSGKLAPWLSEPCATPLDRWVGVYHAKERMAARIKAWDDGQWVRDAAQAHAAKRNVKMAAE